MTAIGIPKRLESIPGQRRSDLLLSTQALHIKSVIVLYRLPNRNLVHTKCGVPNGKHPENKKKPASVMEAG